MLVALQALIDIHNRSGRLKNHDSNEIPDWKVTRSWPSDEETTLIFGYSSHLLPLVASGRTGSNEFPCCESDSIRRLAFRCQNDRSKK